MLFPISIQQVNKRNFNHCITTWLLTHCRTRTTDKNLGSERRVIDSHVELEQLVLGCTRNTLACEVDTVAHIKEVIYTWNFLYMCLVIDEIWIGLDGCSDLIEVITLLYLNINHTTMYSGTNRDCH